MSKSVETVQVTFLPANVTLDCRTDQTLMDAARQRGLKMKIACKNGVCEICKAERLSGEYEFTNPIGSQILERDNQVLCCLALPQTDTQIIMPNVQHPDIKPQLTLAMQVQSVTAANEEMFVIELLAPAGKALDFWPGQYLMLHIPDANGDIKQIPYSIASAPGSLTGSNVRQLQLHIANAGETAARVIAFLQQQPVVTATLPMGDCHVTPALLDTIADEPVMLICAGSGFAQMKAIAEGILATRPAQEIHLYWSNRHSGGFYLQDLAVGWAQQYDNFHFHPILEEADASWEGRAGWIYQVIQHDFSDLTGVHAFACGSPNMVYGTLDQLEPLGLSEANLHSDVFAYAPRPAKS